MKVAQIAFNCDHCYEESPPETSVAAARKIAAEDGWRLGMIRGGLDLCPACVAAWTRPGLGSRGGDPVSDAPKRIQLSRRKDWRKPEGAVVVARPSKWGNPFVVREPVPPELVCYLADPLDKRRQELLRGMTNVRPLEAEQVVDAYAWWLIEQPALMCSLNELVGHDLACWCKLDRPCHADVLLDLANR